MLESWTSKDSKIDLSGYKAYNFYRKFQHRKARRNSGGIILYCKETIYDGISVIRNHFDTIIWVKFDKKFFKMEHDIYLCATYIWGVDSPAYNVNNHNLFAIIENDISYFKTSGVVMVAGDMNSRVGLKPDYIAYDRMNSILDGKDYVPDVPLDRISMDKQCNNYGIQLLDLCKATGLRLCNGRLEGKGSYTYYGYNGNTVIDYLMCEQNNFRYIKSFDISDFNIYSDHAILSIKVLTNCDIPNKYSNNSFQYTKWSPDKRDEFRRRLITRLPDLNHLLNESEPMVSDRNGVYGIADRFVEILNDEAKPLFHKEVMSRDLKCQFNNDKVLKRSDWFDGVCREKKSEYLEALRLFNDYKTEDNRRQLIARKKLYKNCVKRKRSQHYVVKMKEIESLKSKKPYDFWKYFSKKKQNPGANISLSAFHEYFKNLTTEINITTDVESEAFSNDQISTDDPSFPELDSVITIDEVRRAIKSLKRGKAGGIDCLINEYFIEAGDIIGGHLQDLFNMILSSGHFPQSWMDGLIVPVFKKGDESDVQNYRGITLVSVISKIFTCILNNRLSDWCAKNNIVSDAQFGFKKGLSTTDAIFCLNSVISHMLNNKKRLYATFIDMRKCFDSVYRNALWFKMSKLGIGGKMLRIVKSMYEHVRCRVRHGNEFSDFIEISVGLKQGEICSPLLWSLFIEDLELYLGSRPDSGILLDDLTLILLLYADDMVLFSDTAEGLQQSLYDLKMYCDRWGLTVNVDKTKVMVFRKRGPLRVNERWIYNDIQLEVVDTFNYLGVVFDYNGNFSHNTQMLVGKALKAMNCLLTNTKDFDFTPKTMCSLFDSFVSSILSYSAEVWGYTRNKDIERIQLKFLKRILNVKLSSSNIAIYGELGRYPLYVNRFVKIVKFWFKVIHSDNCILQQSYSLLLQDLNNDKVNWCSNVKALLYENGFGYVWEMPLAVDPNQFMILFKQRLLDVFTQKWRSDINDSAVLNVFSHLKQDFQYSDYLSIITNKLYRSIITKFRISAHSLRIEIGRYGQNRLERNERTCEVCQSRDIEDEYHMIFICTRYKLLRKRYIDKYYYERPNMLKLTQLLSNSNEQTLVNLACFLNCSLKVRRNYLE